MTVTVFGYLIFISIDFYDFIFPFIFQSVLDFIFKHLKVRQKYSGARCIFNSSRCLEMWSNTVFGV